MKEEKVFENVEQSAPAPVPYEEYYRLAVEYEQLKNVVASQAITIYQLNIELQRRK